WRASVADPVLALSGSAARRVGAVFERLGKTFAAPGYRGCPFINAAAEYPGPDGPVAAAIAAHRAQVRGLFAELLADVPAARRAALTDQLVLLYDGTMVGAQLDQGPRAARRARAAARQLLEGPAPAR
ncbi:MAG TPA: TetR/AcrR family transcriptional regulator, partial [Streptosporangiaceae bacterium]|nr:TetR/AcrR family transcriptional regulator [Streptosporangiaceae bacterium]